MGGCVFAMPPPTSTSREEFYREYGAAMAAWAFVESELGTLFAILTQLPASMAISIFYSVNAFDARASIFEAAIPPSKLDEKSKGFFEAAISKVRCLSQFWNKLAHDLYYLDGSEYIDLALSFGRYPFRSTSSVELLVSARPIDGRHAWTSIFHPGRQLPHRC